MKDDLHIIRPHGGYSNLLSYRGTQIVSDGNVVFCRRFVDPRSRTYDQMTQATRSAKQNIVEASQDSGRSARTELKLLGVARGSLEELLEDYRDFLRRHNLPIWDKNDPRAVAIRRLAYHKNRSYAIYRRYIEDGDAETAANTMICLIHQASYLLDQQIRSVETKFLEEGGVTERMLRVRREARRRKEKK